MRVGEFAATEGPPHFFLSVSPQNGCPFQHTFALGRELKSLQPGVVLSHWPQQAHFLQKSQAPRQSCLINEQLISQVGEIRFPGAVNRRQYTELRRSDSAFPQLMVIKLCHSTRGLSEGRAKAQQGLSNRILLHLANTMYIHFTLCEGFWRLRSRCPRPLHL